jgi:hypothetical protein
MTVLGGVCCNPKAFRSIESTTIIRVNEESIIKMLGAKPNSVNTANACRAGETLSLSKWTGPNCGPEAALLITGQPNTIIKVNTLV